jgi:hypothetical protein
MLKKLLTKIKVMTIYDQKVKWRLYLHRRGINEYKFNHGPINCMETARRSVLILGNIKSVGIGIIHLSLPFLCILCVLCGLIIPIQLA